VDVDNGFKPLYVIAKEKRPQITKLRSLLKDASEVYLATDEDREGESIAWHLLEVLAPRVPVKRMVFHEITRSAIDHAVEHPRELDRRLVDAQEARRILDRLYGYEVSPVLWKKVMPRLSAGRVQSVATRILVERERARMRFRSGSWWGIDGTFDKSRQQFGATLASIDGQRLATGRDFTETGELRDRAAVVLLDEDGAGDLARRLSASEFSVQSVEERPFTRSPHPPFITSTLQQEAGRKLRFSAQRTMQVAQRLYERGYITYMRTDSTSLSDAALQAARSQARELYGPEYVPAAPRRHDRRVKNAQEAHEAIRPAGDAFRLPDQVAGELAPDELRLYDLVWKRTLASQMTDARGTNVQVRLGAVAAARSNGDTGASPGEQVEMAASGKVLDFPGFLRAYVEGADDPDAELEDQEVRLPRLAVGDRVEVMSLDPAGHRTEPPSRYTEASLVKALEDLGVGRPSTYASIIATIQERGYVWKRGTTLIPSFTAFAVVGLLERYFGDLVDYGFTAGMEDELDEIAGGQEEAVPWLTRFYFGSAAGNGRPDGNERAAGNGPTNGAASRRGAGSGPGRGSDRGRGSGSGPAGSRGLPAEPGLKAVVAGHLAEIDAREINSIPIGEAQSEPLVVRVGRYGPYVQWGERRASVPEDLPPDELTVERALALIDAPSEERTLGTDPESGAPVLLRAGRYGPYVQLGETDSGNGGAPATRSAGSARSSAAPKPRTASLFKSMNPAELTMDQALTLLSLPRVVGVDPDGTEIVAQNGRFGPYLKKGTETRSLSSEEQLFGVTLEEALALFAEPKGRRGARAPAAMRELGVDPTTGSPVVLRSGRFGPYVTDGEVNASLRQGDSPESLTLERAAELLADRRAAAPAARGRASSRAGSSRGRTSAGGSASASRTAGSASRGGSVSRTGSASRSASSRGRSPANSRSSSSAGGSARTAGGRRSSTARAPGSTSAGNGGAGGRRETNRQDAAGRGGGGRGSRRAPG
jgi:DNA topoisomerase-1